MVCSRAGRGRRHRGQTLASTRDRARSGSSSPVATQPASPHRHGDRRHAFVLDATPPAEVEAAAAKAVELDGRLDGLANCVGSILLKPAQLTAGRNGRRPRDEPQVRLRRVRAAARLMTTAAGSCWSPPRQPAGLANHEAIAAAKAGVIGLTLSAAASYARKASASTPWPRASSGPPDRPHHGQQVALRPDRDARPRPCRRAGGRGLGDRLAARPRQSWVPVR